jgi:hypothetical protein
VRRALVLGLAGAALVVGAASLYVAATCGVSYDRSTADANGTRTEERGCEADVEPVVFVPLLAAAMGVAGAWRARPAWLLVVGLLGLPASWLLFDPWLFVIAVLLLAAGLLALPAGGLA